MVGGRYDVGGRSGPPQAGQVAGATAGSSRTLRVSAWRAPGSICSGITLGVGPGGPSPAVGVAGENCGIGIDCLVCSRGTGFASPGKGGKLDKSTVGEATASGSPTEGLCPRILGVSDG